MKFALARQGETSISDAVDEGAGDRAGKQARVPAPCHASLEPSPGRELTGRSTRVGELERELAALSQD